MLPDAYVVHVRHLVDQAPPLSEHQRARISMLLRGALEVDPDRTIGIYPPHPYPRGAAT